MTREMIEELLEQSLQENHFDENGGSITKAMNGAWNNGAKCLADRFLIKVIQRELEKEGE